MLFNHQPIGRPGDDLYARSDFALTVARSIYNFTIAKEGFAFAITGEWGTGKTSVLLLVERYLLHLQISELSQNRLWWQEAATPKNIEQVEEIALLFEKVKPTINTLAQNNKYLLSADIEYQRSVLRKILINDEEVSGALLYWHLSERVRDVPNTIILRFSPWLLAGRAELASALLSELARRLGKFLGNEVKKPFQALLKRFAEFAPLAGAGIGLTHPHLGFVAKVTGKASGVVAEKMTAGSTLEELRQDLIGALRNLPAQKALVIIDDVDRLTPGETAEMISLVKSIGDLPNVIYLLAYQKSRLCNLLETALQVPGDEYLEKIIQQELPLPPISYTAITRISDERIKAIFPGTALDAVELGDLWYSLLRHYLKTPRDIQRYFNALAVAQSELSQVTDPLDLMNIVALKIFEPSIYEYLAESYPDWVN